MFSRTQNKFNEIGIGIMDESDFEEMFLVLMQNLASTDSDIREGSLNILWELLESGEMSDDKMLGMGNQFIANLSVGVDEKGTDSVFLRTFSVLLIGVIVVQDELCSKSGNTFLDESIFTDWFEKTKMYVMAEQDFRSFVPGKGWAHAISHGADVLRSFAFHRYTTAKDHEVILEIIADKLLENHEEVYINNDDNRVARVVVTMMLRDELKISHYEKWLDGLINRFDGKFLLDYGGEREKVIPWFNTITFLRALYFVLLNGMKVLEEDALYEQVPPLRNEVMELLLDLLIKMDHGLNYNIHR